MLRIIKAGKEHSKMWDDFVQKEQKSTFFHQFNWKYVIEKTYSHKSHYYIAINSKKNVLGVLPLIEIDSKIFGKFIVSLPFCDYGGPIGINSEIENLLFEKAISVFNETCADYIEFRAHKNFSNIKMKRLTNKANLILNLENEWEELWKSFKPKVRNQVRKAEKNGLELVFCKNDTNSLKQFYNVFCINMRDLGTPVHSFDLFKWFYHFFKNETEIAHVFFNGKIIASAVIIKFKNYVEVPFAASIKDYRFYCPNNLLYWSIIKKSCVEGFSKFFFWKIFMGKWDF